MCDQQSLRSACAYAQSDQSLCLSLEFSITLRLLAEHYLEFLPLKGGVYRLLWVYTCQNGTLLEITCHSSCVISYKWVHWRKWHQWATSWDSLSNPFLASNHFWCLMITFANSLDTDQDWSGPKPFGTQIVFLKECFEKKKYLKIINRWQLWKL